jgi:hypothetical protein
MRRRARKASNVRWNASGCAGLLWFRAALRQRSPCGSRRGQAAPRGPRQRTESAYAAGSCAGPAAEVSHNASRPPGLGRFRLRWFAVVPGRFASAQTVWLPSEPSCSARPAPAHRICIRCGAGPAAAGAKRTGRASETHTGRRRRDPYGPRRPRCPHKASRPSGVYHSLERFWLPRSVVIPGRLASTLRAPARVQPPAARTVRVAPARPARAAPGATRADRAGEDRFACVRDGAVPRPSAAASRCGCIGAAHMGRVKERQANARLRQPSQANRRGTPTSIIRGASASITSEHQRASASISEHQREHQRASASISEHQGEHQRASPH